MPRLMLPGLTVVALFVASATASAQGLKEFRERQQLAVQKLTKQVDEAINQSFKQAPNTAKRELMDLREEVLASTDLQLTQRDELAQRLQTRINAVRDAARAKDAPITPNPPRTFDTPKSGKPPVDPRGGVYNLVKDWTVPLKRDQLAHAAMIAQRQAGIQALNMPHRSIGRHPGRGDYLPALLEAPHRRAQEAGRAAADRERSQTVEDAQLRHVGRLRRRQVQGGSRPHSGKDRPDDYRR